MTDCVKNRTQKRIKRMILWRRQLCIESVQKVVELTERGRYGKELKVCCQCKLNGEPYYQTKMTEWSTIS
uniref:Uncharacterized protein n=1 Tax=Amphimedon queenslandica TaxID=400682 RepID=A0A1X7TNU1_AMPQE